MGILKINGVTVFANHVETVEDGVSYEYDRLLGQWRDEVHLASRSATTLEEAKDKTNRPVPPKAENYPAVIVKLTSGREFRIVGGVREHVEHDVLIARRRG